MRQEGLPKKIFKAKYSDEDIRIQALEARDELMANVEFLMECIREDRLRLQFYKEKFGDVRYRPLIKQATTESESVYGLPTEVSIEPLSAKYRVTISSLLQSILLIQDELLQETDVEGASLKGTRDITQSNASRASLRDSFLSDAATEKTPIQPTEPTDEELESTKPLKAKSPTKLVEKANSTTKALNKPTTPQSQADDSKTSRRPWRETTPKATKQLVEEVSEAVDDVVETPTPITSPETQAPKKLDPTQVGLSPMLRMQMRSSGGKLDSMREKYRSGESKVVKQMHKNEENPDDNDASD